jgi:hypothetical protein
VRANKPNIPTPHTIQIDPGSSPSCTHLQPPPLLRLLNRQVYLWGFYFSG